MTLANAAHLGIERFTNTPAKENWANAHLERQGSPGPRHVSPGAGQQNAMASERLKGPESLFKNGGGSPAIC